MHRLMHVRQARTIDSSAQNYKLFLVEVPDKIRAVSRSFPFFEG